MYENIKNIIKVINEDSPVRRQIDISDKFKETYITEADELKKVQGNMEIIYNKVNNPLKVVLMGEVKAGKSTIVNSIVGETISYVNVVEATAAIIEIEYGFVENALIKKKNGDNIEGSIEEINNIIEKNLDNEEFFKNVDVVKIRKNLKNLDRLSIIDTPGLETITTSNEEKTKNYIQESDVVIWVINCNHLGQSDVTQNIEEIFDLGKPVILIANRIDEIDAEKEEVVEYLEDELGYMVKNVIPMSAKQAYQGVINNDKKLMERSGYTILMDTIYSMNSKSEQIQQESIIKSFEVQMRKDINIHDKIKLYTKEVNDDINIRLKNLDKYKNTLENNIQNKVNMWFDDEFLVDEIDEIAKNKDEYTAKTYLSDSYIRNIVTTYLSDLDKYITKEWQIYSDHEINEHIKTIDLKYQTINQEYYINELNESNQVTLYKTEEVVEHAKKGAMTGGKIGLAIAGYAAWLGPAAAHVTIIGSLGAVMPPLIAGGALLSGAIYLKNRAFNDKQQVDVKQKLLDKKQELKREYVESILESTNLMNSNILDEAKRQLKNNIVRGFVEMGIKDTDEFVNKINIYINLIEKINNKGNKVWVIDTNVFIDEPYILNGFDEDETIVISKQVVNELDKKKSVKDLRRNVQIALDNIRRSEVVFEDIDKEYISQIYDNAPDNFILSAAVKYKRMDVTMLTSDKNLIVKCKAEGIDSMSLDEFRNSSKFVRVLK